MARIKSLAFAWLLLASAVTASAQQPPPPTESVYEINGTVVAHGTQAPLSSVLVSITPVVTQGRGESWSVVTGADGAFQFTGLARGKYALSAEQRGRQPQQFLGHGPFSTAIVAGPGLDSQHIVFALFQEGRITGTARDEDGEAVTGAQVFLFRKLILDGEERIVMQQQGNTSNGGSFHFGHLRPGNYRLAVSARPWYAGNVQYFQPQEVDGNVVNEPANSAAALDRAFPVTYSGDTTEAAAAQPITIAEGATAPVDITLHSVPAVRVTMQGAEWHPGEGMALTATGPGGLDIAVQNVALPIAREGKPFGWVLAGIAPGSYRLNVSHPAAKTGQTESHQLIQLSDGGAASITKIGTVALSGHVTFNDPAPPGESALLLIRAQQQITTAVKSDGTFAFEQPVEAGHYRLAVTGQTVVPVQGIAVGKAATAGPALDIPAGSSGSLEMSVMAGPASHFIVEGTALRDGKPVPAAMILLLPDDVANAAVIGRDQSDSDGTFAIPDVHPGHYTLLAFDCDSDDESCGLAYRDPAALKPYLAQGMPLALPQTDGRAIQVAVIKLTAALH